MPTSTAFNFEHYTDLIQKPFERSDVRSFQLIDTLLLSFDKSSRRNRFAALIEALSGIVIAENEALYHWKKILEHKRRIELKLNRLVAIRAVVIDYYDQLGISFNQAISSGHPEQQTGERTATAVSAEDRLLYQFIEAQKSKAAEKGTEATATFIERLTLIGYHQERFKEELMRARRYRNALSTIMFALDLQVVTQSSVTPETRDKAFDIVVKIINKTIRTVDILTRYSDSHFMIILPNTNKREASELAERLRKNIIDRTAKIPGFSGFIPITLAVGQCGKDDTTADFGKRLENLLESGRKRAANSVYTLE